MHLHLVDMFMLERESVCAIRLTAVMRGALVLEFGGHRLAPARVPGHRVARDWPVGRHQSRAHQWPDDGKKPRRIASWIGHAPCLAQLVTASALQLGKAEHPIG